jgi:hypothetical protein
VQEDEPRWPLKELRGSITAADDDNDDACDIHGERLLVFKLSGDLNEGRQVDAISRGYYLLVVPADWTSDQPARLIEEPIDAAGNRAYVLTVDPQAAGVTFTDSTGHSYRTARRPSFELQGITPGSNMTIPFFLRQPPIMVASNAEQWSTIATIVVGSEGPERDGWRIDFPPSPQFAECKFPDLLNVRQCGWYFVRFYDSDEQLVDSLDFRFAAGLLDVQIAGLSAMPAKEGYPPVRLTFVHKEGWDVHSSSGSSNCVALAAGERTFEVLPRPEVDAWDWTIEDDRHSCVVLSLSPLWTWWALSHGNDGAVGWCDKVVQLKLADLAAGSASALLVRSSRPDSGGHLLVRTTGSAPRRFSIGLNAPSVTIPLREFADSVVRSRPGTMAITAELSYDGELLVTKLAELRLCMSCRNCAFRTVSSDEMDGHISDNHLAAIFPELSYEEYRRREPKLPASIFMCPYCEKYITSNEVYQTTEIAGHIEKAHHERVKFRNVHDVTEIRDAVVSSLPHVHKCKFCAVEYENPTLDTMRGHASTHLRLLREVSDC